VIVIDKVSKRFPGKIKDLEVLQEIDIIIETGQLVSIVGPTGSGKTTLLKLICGIDEKLHSGSISVDGILISNYQGADIGYLPQNLALAKWLTVEENVAFVLRRPIFGLSKKQIKDKVSSLLEQFDLHHFRDHYVDQLSGGMRQKVALARLIATKPKILLMDEPFSSLDGITRFHLNDKLLRMWESYKPTIIFVTHDIDEAVFLSTKVVVFSHRPAVIKEVFKIDLPYPRRQETRFKSNFQDKVEQVWKTIEE